MSVKSWESPWNRWTRTPGHRFPGSWKRRRTRHHRTHLRHRQYPDHCGSRPSVYTVCQRNVPIEPTFYGLVKRDNQNRPRQRQTVYELVFYYGFLSLKRVKDNRRRIYILIRSLNLFGVLHRYWVKNNWISVRKRIMVEKGSIESTVSCRISNKP